MSNPFNLKVGSIIHEMESNIDHRVIYENSDCFVTILIHSPYGKAVINEWYSEMIRNLLENREIVIHEPKYDKVFDEDNLSLKEKELYLRNKDIVELECFAMLVEQGNISMLLPTHPIRNISTSC